MPWFNARMIVTHDETWAVEADDIDEARKLFDACDDRVQISNLGDVTKWSVFLVEEDPRG
jgi:hypothetical protein